MAQEIERKFLVKSNVFKETAFKQVKIKQGTDSLKSLIYFLFFKPVIK